MWLCFELCVSGREPLSHRNKGEQATVEQGQQELPAIMALLSWSRTRLLSFLPEGDRLVTPVCC